MEIELYKLNKPKNALDKEPITTDIGIVLRGELNESADISNPVITIDVADVSMMIGLNYNVNDFKNDYMRFNYAIIFDFKRGYFITDITVVSKNIIQISFHVDVLYSFDAFIYHQTAFVTRNENRYNVLLPDERLIMTNQKIIVEYEPSVGSLVNTEFKTSFSGSDNLTITDAVDLPVVINSFRNSLMLTSPQYRSGKKKELEIDGLPEEVENAFNPSTSWSYVTNAHSLDTVLSSIFYNANDEGKIGGIYVYPFSISRDEMYHENNALYRGLIWVWDHNIPNTEAGFLLNKTSNELIVADFILDEAQDFKDLEPYSKYELYLPYYGWIELDYNSLQLKQIIVYYVVNYADGSAVVNVLDKDDNIIVFSSTCQLGVQIGTSTTNTIQVQDKNRQNNTNLMLSLLSSAVAVGGGILTGNPVAAGMGVVGGALNVGKAIANYNETAITNYKNMTIALNGSISPLYMYQKVKIRKTSTVYKLSRSSAFLSDNGGVLNSFEVLGDLHGYTEISIIPKITYNTLWECPLENEMNELLTLLRNGVVL